MHVYQESQGSEKRPAVMLGTSQWVRSSSFHSNACIVRKSAVHFLAANQTCKSCNIAILLLDSDIP